MTSEASPAIKAVRAIDKFSDAVGTCVSFLAVPLVFGVSYEVFARYAFNRPTVWAFDLTYMLYGCLFMLGSAYALLKGAHIRTDFFWEKFPPRRKGLIDTVAYIVFFFPSLAVFLWISGHEAWVAFDIGETSEQTAWRPALWPMKAAISLSALLLLIQGVSELLKSWHLWQTGDELEHREKIDI